MTTADGSAGTIITTIFIYFAQPRKCAIVLTAVKTKPTAALKRAGLDRRCARRRSHRAAGTEEWLRRGRTKE